MDLEFMGEWEMIFHYGCVEGCRVLTPASCRQGSCILQPPGQNARIPVIVVVKEPSPVPLILFGFGRFKGFMKKQSLGCWTSPDWRIPGSVLMNSKKEHRPEQRRIVHTKWL